VSAATTFHVMDGWSGCGRADQVHVIEVFRVVRVVRVFRVIRLIGVVEVFPFGPPNVMMGA